MKTKQIKQSPLPSGTRVYYTGDQANAAGWLVVVGTRGADDLLRYDLIEQETGNRIFSSINDRQIGRKYAGHCDPRFVTAEAYFTYRAAKLDRVSMMTVIKSIWDSEASGSMDATLEIWSFSDGYGERGLVPPQGYDWSGIRDSSIEAVRRMYVVAAVASDKLGGAAGAAIKLASAPEGVGDVSCLTKKVVTVKSFSGASEFEVENEDGVTLVLKCVSPQHAEILAKAVADGVATFDTRCE